MAKMSLTDKARSFILNKGRRQSQRKAGIDYKEIVDLTNRKFRTNFSVYQIAAYLGNHGLRRG